MLLMNQEDIIRIKNSSVSLFHLVHRPRRRLSSSVVMNSILFLAVLLISSSVSFVQSQEAQEPFVDDDDTLDAAARAPKGKKEPEPKYPDGVNTIPGDAEKDYPTYDQIWKTGFSCSQRPPGFYADVEARCQIWHTCDTRGHQQSFLCSNGTIFSQANRVCEWWYNVNCELKEVEANYQVNDDLYQIPESASHWQEDNERRENEAKSLAEKFPPKPQPQSSFNYREKEEEQREQQKPRESPKSRPQESFNHRDEDDGHYRAPERQQQQYREPVKPQQQQRPQQNYNNREDDGKYRQPARQQQQQYREPVKQQQQQQQKEPVKPQASFNYKDNTRQNEVQQASSKPRAPPPLVPLTHVIGRDEIRAILNNQKPEQDNSGLSEDERFPIKAKLRMQREHEARRLKALEEAKLKEAKDNEPKPLPVRVVKLDQNQQQPTKPAIIRLSNNFGVNPPKSTPQSFRPQQQYSTTTQAPVYRPTTTTTYAPRSYATQRTTTPWATTTPTTTTTRRPPQDNYVRPTAPPPPPPPPATPADYNRPRLQDNYVRPSPRDEHDRNKFENTDESKFPQQPQARAFPSFHSSSKPIRIEDPVVNSAIQDERANRYQQQQERRFHHSDVNADGNRFQNGETRRGVVVSQQQQQQQKGQQQQQDRRPAQNRYQNEEEPTTERPRPQNVDRGQPAARPQQQQQPQRNFRQQEESVRPQQEQRRPRPKNDEAPPPPPPPARRPYQEEERQAPPQRKPTPEPELRNAVREFQGKPESSPPVYAGPQFAAPESHRQKFRHSTPRRHNVQFAPSSRSDRDAEESQVSEESQQHPVPSVYNHRFVHPQQQRQEVPKSLPDPFVEEKIYSWQTTKRPEPVRPTEPEPPVRTYSHRPTPRPETVLPVREGGAKNPTIVRIIVKQRPQDQRQPERRRSDGPDESLDVREEEEFIHQEAERGFGGRYRS